MFNVAGDPRCNRPDDPLPCSGGKIMCVSQRCRTAACPLNNGPFDLRYARAHQKDSLVVSYALDSTGAVQRDSLGRPVGATYAPNRYASERVAARRKHLEDYYALLIANHLLAGAEAFVSAQLWDVPEHVSIRALPFGPALVASFRW